MMGVSHATDLEHLDNIVCNRKSVCIGQDSPRQDISHRAVVSRGFQINAERLPNLGINATIVSLPTTRAGMFRLQGGQTVRSVQPPSLPSLGLNCVRRAVLRGQSTLDRLLGRSDHLQLDLEARSVPTWSIFLVS